jgi:hypothetical protein
MASLSGDTGVTQELTSYVHIEIVVDLANELNWQSERGDQMWRRLAALAVFELLNGERCLICNGKGSIGREQLQKRTRETTESARGKLIEALHRLRRAQWLLSSREQDIENMAEFGYIPTDSYLHSLRRVRHAVERIEREMAATTGMVTCHPCRGTGKLKILEMQRAWAVGVSRKSWYSLWMGRYAVVRGELDGWRSTCLTHVRRYIDGVAAA